METEIYYILKNVGAHSTYGKFIIMFPNGIEASKGCYYTNNIQSATRFRNLDDAIECSFGGYFEILKCTNSYEVVK